MKRIYKYPVLLGAQSIPMPEGAQVLTAQLQQGQINIWALVDPNAEEVINVIEVYGTGHDLKDTTDKHNYIGSVQQGPFVWHVFGWIK